MKCILRNELLLRVDDKEARHLVANEGWIFVPKELWKETNKALGYDGKEHARKNSLVVPDLLEVSYGKSI